MRRTIIYMSLLFILLSKRSQAQSPNIIVIIADDMGWNQVSSDKTTSINGTSYPSDFFETPTLTIWHQRELPSQMLMLMVQIVRQPERLS